MAPRRHGGGELAQQLVLLFGGQQVQHVVADHRIEALAGQGAALLQGFGEPTGALACPQGLHPLAAAGQHLGAGLHHRQVGLGQGLQQPLQFLPGARSHHQGRGGLGAGGGQGTGPQLQQGVVARHRLADRGGVLAAVVAVEVEPGHGGELQLSQAASSAAQAGARAAGTGRGL